MENSGMNEKELQKDISKITSIYMIYLVGLISGIVFFIVLLKLFGRI